MYEVAFTTGFRDGLRGIDPSASVLNAIQRCVDVLKADPFQKIPNAKRLRHSKARFRARLGDLRLLYRIEQTLDRVVLFAIGYRQSIYKRDGEGGRVLPTRDRPVVELLNDRKRARSTPVDVAPATPPPHDIDIGAEIAVEVAQEWITEDELWLLRVPTEHWQAILQAASAEALPENVPVDVQLRIESYVTSPAGNQLGRIYALGDDGVDCITRRPLHEFLTALDPDQQRVIQSGLDKGPYLVRGGPGTGKSLIGLHAIQEIVRNRNSESLFASEGRPRFGVLTYTNTLSGFNESLLRHIRETANDEIEIHCRTIDKVVYALAKVALQRRPEPRDHNQVKGWMLRHVVPMLGTAERKIVERLGLTYIVEEIEKVLHDSNIQDLDEYLEFERRGRQIQLQKPEREAVWAIFEVYQSLREQFRIDSWEFMRKIALRQLLSDATWPRYNALFVDEVQDLSLTARQLILNLVQDRRFLLMTDDPAQSIYLFPPRWKQVDDALDFRGRSFILRRNYRTTKEIYRAIESLRLDADEDGTIGIPVPQFSGPKPTWLAGASPEHLGIVATAIRALNKHYPLGNMGIIVRTNDGAKQCAAGLHALGVVAAMVNRDSPIDLGGDAVHVITAHSAKGLEFPAVIVPDVSDRNYPGVAGDAASQEQVRESEDAAKRLLYVALSRACQRLVMITDSEDPSRFEREFDQEQWDHAL